MNKVVSATAKLVRTIRSADRLELEEAFSALSEFGESWLVHGTMNNLPGLNDCCLSDTDVTEPIREAIVVRLENAE